MAWIGRHSLGYMSRNYQYIKSSVKTVNRQEKIAFLDAKIDGKKYEIATILPVETSHVCMLTLT